MVSLTTSILFLYCPSSNTTNLTCLVFLRRLISRIFTSNVERGEFLCRGAFKITSSPTSRFLSRVSPVLLLVNFLDCSVAFFVFFSGDLDLDFSGEGGLGLALPSLSNIFTTWCIPISYISPILFGSNALTLILFCFLFFISIIFARNLTCPPPPTLNVTFAIILSPTDNSSILCFLSSGSIIIIPLVRL